MKKTVLLCILGLFGMAALAAPVQAAEHTVRMISKGDKGSFYFEPKKLTIKSGDTVTWVNMQDDTHNVMAESVPKTSEAFSSPDLKAKGDKWSYTFKTSGTYRYHCHPHEQMGMAGTIIVDRPSRADEVKEVNIHSGHTHLRLAG
jgi:plastocyanin